MSVKPISTFRLNLEPRNKQWRRFYYEAKIFQARDEMHQYVEANRKRLMFHGALRCEAITLSFDMLKLKDKRWHCSPKVGEILFYTDSVGAGVVSHECTHAMFHFAVRSTRGSRFKSESRLEEYHCWIQGWLVTQFWRKFWRRFPEGFKCKGNAGY